MPKRLKSHAKAQGFVRLILVRPFIEELERQNVDAEQLVMGLGLDPDALNDPERYVHADTIYSILDACAAAVGDPHLGYHVGSRHDFAAWPPFQRAVRVARTVGEFLSDFIAAVPTEANSVRHELSVTASGACYSVHRLIEPKNSPQHTEAFGIAHFIRLFQAISQASWQPDQVLIRTQYADAVPTRVQGARVEKKASGGLEVNFPAAWLHAPIELRSAFFKSDAPARNGLARDVSLIAVFQASAKTMLHNLSAGLEDVAGAVGLNTSELRAALKNEGTSAAKEFRRLRLETAKKRLRDGDGSISEIAGDLGYADPAHFSRFFRMQSGQSPREFRRTAQQNTSR